MQEARTNGIASPHLDSNDSGTNSEDNSEAREQQAAMLAAQDLQQQVQEAAAHIAEMQSALAGRDNQLKQLREERTQLQQLQQDLQMRDNQIMLLHDQAAKQEAVQQELKLQLAAKDAELQHALADVQTKLSEIKATETLTDGLQKRLAEAEAAAQSLQAEVEAARQAAWQEADAAKRLLQKAKDADQEKQHVQTQVLVGTTPLISVVLHSTHTFSCLQLQNLDEAWQIEKGGLRDRLERLQKVSKLKS